mmetsp:Transcript_3241/g.11028  ORF Transcript_3241/g.11028 Transcript_3241/m.11028 type:complete len:330 (-) Transcript_3241:4788-5777(-)
MHALRLVLYGLLFNLHMKFPKAEYTKMQVQKNRIECQVVFTLGLEGVGHHGFAFGSGKHSGFLRNLLRQHVSKNVHKLGISNSMFSQELENDLRALDYSNIFSTYRRKCKRRGFEACYSAPSYSFPNRGGPFLPLNYSFAFKKLKRWDEKNSIHTSYLNSVGHPLHIIRFYETGIKYCDIKFILLHRNLVETVLSHETWDGGLEAHMNVLLLFARHINSQLTQIPKNAWIRINYEDFWEIPKKRRLILKKVLDFLGWKADIEEALKCFSLRVNDRSIDCSKVKSLNEIQINTLNSLKPFADKNKHPGGKILSSFFVDSPKGARYKKMCI